MERTGRKSRITLGAASLTGAAVASVIHVTTGSTLDGTVLWSLLLAIFGVLLLAQHAHESACDDGNTYGTGSMGMGRETVVRALTTAEDNARRGLPATPAPGKSVRLWCVDGAWRVWSAGPARGTWWLQPTDTAADDIMAALIDGANGAPIVHAIYHTPRTRALAVATRDMRPTITIGGEA
jgi:hypothetical protein